MTADSANEGELIYLDPAAGFEIRAIAPSEREIVATLVRDGFAEERAAPVLATLAELPDDQIFIALLRRQPVAAYAIRKDGLANDLPVIVVAADHRQQGMGRAMLQDALRRSGRRPLAAQTPEAVLPFFKACGFKLVGRRVQPSGEVWFRVGWHAPGARFKGGTSSALTNPGLTNPSENDS